MVGVSVPEVSLDNWANGVLLMSFSCMVSMVLVLWGFKDKIMLHCFKEVKYQLQEFDIRHKLFYDISTERVTVAF